MNRLLTAALALLYAATLHAQILFPILGGQVAAAACSSPTIRNNTPKGDYFYLTTHALTASASVNDVLVIITVSATATTSMAITGATATMTKRVTGTGSGPNNVSIYTGLVSGSGTPTVTITGGSDVAFNAWIVGGLTSATPDGTGANGNVTTNPLNTSATITTSACTNAFIAWGDENTDDFLSFTSSFVTDEHNSAHEDAFGHRFTISTGTYQPGVNLTTGVATSAMAVAFMK